MVAARARDERSVPCEQPLRGLTADLERGRVEGDRRPAPQLSAVEDSNTSPKKSAGGQGQAPTCEVNHARGGSRYGLHLVTLAALSGPRG